MSLHRRLAETAEGEGVRLNQYIRPLATVKFSPPNPPRKKGFVLTPLPF
jgi:hypothetical protein